MVHFLCQNVRFLMSTFLLSYRVEHSGGTTWHILCTALTIVSSQESKRVEHVIYSTQFFSERQKIYIFLSILRYYYIA
jgi:hypothetical protein